MRAPRSPDRRAGTRWLPIREARGEPDLVQLALDHSASWVIVPTSRLSDDFFDLRTGMAGELTQRMANYRIGPAVIGDVSGPMARNARFAEFVREANRGEPLWLLASLEDFEERLARGA